MTRQTPAAPASGWALALSCLLGGFLVARASAAEPILFAKPSAFQTLVNPNCSHCVDEAKSRAADLRANDPVLAWMRGKYEGGAIPIRFFLNPYRVISDTYGVFVFDPDAGFSRGYEPSLDFSFYGWRNGIVVMRHKDGTLFSTLSGRAFEGPRKGEQLKAIPTLTTSWGYWNNAYPGSVAYRMFEKYQPIELSLQDNIDSTHTRAPADRRLAESTEILGVTGAGVWKAYPLPALPRQGGVIHDQLGNQEIAILWLPSTRTAAAYATRIDDTEAIESVSLAFDAAQPSAPFVDRKSGSRFGVEGRAVSGPLKGKTLTWIDSVQCKWFAWAAEHPHTEIHATANNRPGGNGRDPQSFVPQTQTTHMVLVGPEAVTPRQIENWRGEGFAALVVPLDEDHPADAYQAAAAAAAAARWDLYYWIEIARNPRLADAHPRWMASLGMHDDWLTRFPGEKKPAKGEISKAYPWVPIGYREAFQAHLNRLERLLKVAPDTYRGLLLNDLQGGPASCGCGNLLCRWALDYGVPETAAKAGADDAAVRFVGKARQLAPGKQVVPVWTTECEMRDLPPDQAPGGQSTGWCGSVPCAKGTCPRAFAKQLQTLLQSHDGPLGLLTAQAAFQRDPKLYAGPAGWIPSSVDYLDATPLSPTVRGVPHERLWLVVDGATEHRNTEAAARATAHELHPAAIIVARIPLDQSYLPRTVAID